MRTGNHPGLREIFRLRALLIAILVVVMGTAFAWVHWLDRVRDEGPGAPLPPGSRLMETGGFKGRSREVPRVELYRELSGALGIPVDRMVNEYGMTELLSQLYEPVLADEAPTSLEDRIHRPPPWLRVRGGSGGCWPSSTWPTWARSRPFSPRMWAGSRRRGRWRWRDGRRGPSPGAAPWPWKNS